MQKKLITRIKTNFQYQTGLFEIPTVTKKFIWTHFNFFLFTTIPGIFINTFFFRQDGKISTVSIYNAVVVFGLALTMHISSQISLKKSPAYVLRIGVILFNFFYIALLLLQNNAARYILLLGALNAIASGFYWQGYNEMLKYTTSERIFDKAISLIGTGNSVVNLAVPVVSGVIISNCAGTLGYTIIFGLSFLFSLYTTYLTTRLSVEKINASSNLTGVYRFIFTDKNALMLFIAEAFRGVKSTAYPLFLSVIFFKLLKNEAILGINTTLCGLVSVLSYIIAGRLIRPNNRLKCIFLSTVISTVLSLPLLFFMNSAILFILSIVNAIIIAFLDNPTVGIFYNHFDKPARGITFSQIMSVREIFFALGRVAGLIMFINFSASSVMLAVFALVMNASTIVTWLLYKFFANKNNESI
ncbi:MAG TPA: hypothetical protein VHO66_01800 [Ruminiclostridium sp.]|nr:hypothetical protein [Ruminiclostridium sp.]